MTILELAFILGVVSLCIILGVWNLQAQKMDIYVQELEDKILELKNKNEELEEELLNQMIVNGHLAEELKFEEISKAIAPSTPQQNNIIMKRKVG